MVPWSGWRTPARPDRVRAGRAGALCIHGSFEDRGRPAAVAAAPLFDHLRQDEKILYALIKFYLRSPELTPDTLDKLDLLLTRIASPTHEGRVSVRSTTERSTSSVAKFASIRMRPGRGPW
jgi:hypothetical protein